MAENKKAVKNPNQKKKKKATQFDNFFKGVVRENPIFVFLLGLCPALAVTNTLETALGMGVLVIFVLTASNLVVSLIKNLIPDQIQIPAYIVVIATFVTIVGLLTEAYAFELHQALGIFIPLIVVNCLIMGRATAYASKNGPFNSIIDGVGMGVGFMLAMMLIGVSREILATGAITFGRYLPLPFEVSLIDTDMYMFNMEVFVGPAGGFIMIGVFLAIFTAIGNYNKRKKAQARQAWIEQKKKEAAERKKRKAMEEAGDSA